MAERRNVMAERKGMVERRNVGRECHDRAKIISHQQRGHGRAERNVKAIGKRPRRNGRNMNVVEGTEGTEIGNGTGRAIGKGGNRKVVDVIGKNGTGRDVTAAGNGKGRQGSAEGNISRRKGTFHS